MNLQQQNVIIIIIIRTIIWEKSKFVKLSESIFEYIKDLAIFLILNTCIRCSFKFLLKVGVEESIVNAPVCRVKTQTTEKVRLDLNS
jgi:hypothetical protein